MTAIADHIGRYRIGQGRYAGEPFRLLGWQRRFLRVFNGPGDGAMSLARGNGKSVFVAAIAASAVDVGGPLVEPMGATVCIASSFDQAKEAIFDHLLWFLRPDVGSVWDWTEGSVSVAGLGEPGCAD